MKNLNTHKIYLLRKLVRIKNVGWISKLIRYLKRLVIPGFQGVPFWEVMKFFLESVFKGVLFQRAAAMTYNIFMALIPMLMALIATLSFLGDSLQQYLINFIQSILPDNAWEFVSQILNDLIQRQNNTIFWLSLGLGVYLTFICINSIINSLNITYFKIRRRNGIKQLPISFIMVICFYLVIILACGIFLGSSHLIRIISDYFGDSGTFYHISILVVRWVLIFVLVYTMLSSLFYFAPYDKKYFHFFSAGSMFSTITLMLLMTVLNLYFSHFSTYNVVYGSIGALLIILLCIYWGAAVVLIGFDLNVSICIAKQCRVSEDEEWKIESTIQEEDTLE
jgi:membrane protein